MSGEGCVYLFCNAEYFTNYNAFGIGLVYLF